MDFWKVQALGNDFVLFDDRDGNLSLSASEISSLCNRNFGVGGDGLLIVRSPSDSGSTAEFEMIYHNADGSLAEMCGNGIRCFAKFVYDHGLTATTRGLRILTGAGVKIVDLNLSGGKVESVKVNMGAPIFERSDIPMAGAGDTVDIMLEVPGHPPTLDALHLYVGNAVSMGNPHFVIFVDDVDHAPVTTAGPLIEHHELFPQKTNVQFAQILSRDEVRARVWERGVGETLASGTSSCAITAAGSRLGLLDRSVKVSLPGGDLLIDWSDSDDIYMTGTAKEVFHGQFDMKTLETEDA